MGLSLTVLGCDGSYPGPGGAGSGYLLRGGGATVWLDAGPGTLAALQTHVRIQDVDAVVVSHEHPDHRNDLEGFAVACQYVLEHHGVPVYAPAGVRQHGYHTGPPALLFSDVVDGSAFEVGGMRFTASRTDHGPETLAVRVDCDGRSLGFSADTGPAWHPSALGPPLDLYLCEATFTAEHEGGGGGGHLSGRQAGSLAREAGVRRLVVTHLWPITDPGALVAEAATAFGGPVERAVPGLVLDV